MPGILVNLTLNGLPQMLIRWRRRPKDLQRNIERALDRSADILVRSIGETMRGERTRAKREGRQVTAPEGILGVDTGRGQQSINKSGIERHGAEWRIRVFSQVPYLPGHELRGRYRWLKPALDRVEDRIRAELHAVHRIR